jgi:hypothetical protein
MVGGWRKLHNKELHDLYSSPSIMTKSRRMRWAGHIAHEGGKEFVQGFGRKGERK